MVVSSWKRSQIEKTFTLEVQIPVNSEAEIVIPKLDLQKYWIRESGKVLLAEWTVSARFGGGIRGKRNSEFVRCGRGIRSLPFSTFGGMRVSRGRLFSVSGLERESLAPHMMVKRSITQNQFRWIFFLWIGIWGLFWMRPLIIGKSEFTKNLGLLSPGF